MSYEGGGANGPLGFGWSLPTAYVQRRSDKGIPTYGENIGFERGDTFINEMKEELVPLTNGFCFCKNEGTFIRYRQTNGYWEGVMPNGTRMEFGLTEEGRIQDTNASPAHVFCWLLQRETDTHGNTVVYSYSSFAGGTIPTKNTLVPSATARALRPGTTSTSYRSRMKTGRIGLRARLHRCFEADVRKWKAGAKFTCHGSKYASVEDGWTGIAFIETAVKSSAKKGAWAKMPKAI